MVGSFQGMLLLFAQRCRTQMKIVMENNCGPILFLGRWLSVTRYLRKIERNYHSGEHVLTTHFRWQCVVCGEKSEHFGRVAIFCLQNQIEGFSRAKDKRDFFFF